jgi:hypothetical protein
MHCFHTGDLTDVAVAYHVGKNWDNSWEVGKSET